MKRKPTSKPRTPPSYRLHKPSGRAVVTLGGKDHYLGPYGSRESHSAYDRVIAEWLSRGRRPPVEAESLNVNRVIHAYWEFAKSYYRKTDGTPTREHEQIKLVLGYLRRLYGRTPASDFGPSALKAIRQVMLERDLARKTINDYISRVRRVFKWAGANELVPASVYQSLKTVDGLRKNRSPARESRRVLPVPDEHIEAVLPFVSAQVAAMIRLQAVTGARPGEILVMRPCDLDRRSETWAYFPMEHKGEHRDLERRIYLGPKAQEILKPFLIDRDDHDFVFSAQEAERARNAQRRLSRVSPMTPTQAARKPKRNPERFPGGCYTVAAYRRTIARACQEASVPKWHPHQLRHNAATKLREQFGIEAARVVLGHRTAAVTEIYAEVDFTRASEIMASVG